MTKRIKDPTATNPVVANPRVVNVSKNQRAILLNGGLLFVATLLSELILRDFFGEPYVGAFVGGVVSSIILRVIFGSGREFKKKKTITASRCFLKNMNTLG